MKRRCVECGVNLAEEDVMKIKTDDGSWETIPIPVCPDCFVKRMREQSVRPKRAPKELGKP